MSKKINPSIHNLSIFCWGVGILPFSIAHAQEERGSTQYNSALIWTPLPSVLINSALRDFEEEGALIDIGASDFGLRLQHRLNTKLGWNLQVDYTQISLFTRTTYVGVRGGPRFFFQPTTLQGWSSTPFVSLGRSMITAGTYSLSSWFVLGIGGEVNHTWLWGRFVVDIGLGAYAATNIGYVAHAQTMEGSVAPEQIIGLKPILNLGLGYVF